MPETRYIKETKRYRDQGLNQHHRDGETLEPAKPARAVEAPKNRKRRGGSTTRPEPKRSPQTRNKGGATLTARMLIQLVVLSIATHFYVHFFYEIFAVFAAVPAIWFLSIWGRLLQKVAPHRSAGALAFESGLLMLILIWVIRVGSIAPAYPYLLILFDPLELGYRMGDLWAVAPPFTMMAWIIEIIALPVIAPIRIYRARQPKSDYDPFRN